MSTGRECYEFYFYQLVIKTKSYQKREQITKMGILEKLKSNKNEPRCGDYTLLPGSLS